jgi:hypothetical protein
MASDKRGVEARLYEAYIRENNWSWGLLRNISSFMGFIASS